MNTERRSPLMCPSAQPGMQAAVVLGVMQGAAEQKRLGWLERPVPVTPELLALAGPVHPTEVFRFAAQCEESACAHFDGAECRLATRIVQILPAVTQPLPPCQIRMNCRWYQQEGKAACQRCPQVLTQNYNPSEELIRAATPA